MQCLYFFQQVDSNGQVVKSLTLVNIVAIVKKDVFSKLILNIQRNYGNYKVEYPKELWELHNDYSLAPVKEEIKKKMLSEYQLKIVDFCNIPTGNFKKLVTNLLDKEEHVCH